MYLTGTQTLIMIAAVSLGTAITRFTPFLLFPDNRKPPEIIIYLGKVLPAAMMGLLVVYCLRNTPVTGPTHGLPEFIAVAATAILHKWRDNVLLSIGAGTVLYMILVQMVFV